MPAYPRRTPTVVLTTLGLTLALAACSNDSSDDLPPPPPSTPADTQAPAQTIELTPEEEQAVEEAKAKFDEFMHAYIEEATTGEPYDTPMGPVVGGRPLEHSTVPLYLEIEDEFVEYYEKNQIAKGDLRWTFLNVEDIDLDLMVGDENVPAVWLRYCIDPTNWQIVDAETKQPTGPATGLPDSPEAAIFEAVWFDDADGARTEGWRIDSREWTGESC